MRVGSANAGAAFYSFSDGGTLVYVPGTGTGAFNEPLGLMDRNGQIEVLELPPAVYSVLRVSPDGNRIGYSRDSGDGENVSADRSEISVAQHAR